MEIFLLFFFVQKIWFWLTWFCICRICCSADMFSAPLSLTRGCLTSCSNESHNTFVKTLISQQLWALCIVLSLLNVAQVATSLPTENFRDGLCTQVTIKTQHGMQDAVHCCQSPCKVERVLGVFISTILSDGGLSEAHAVPRLLLNYSSN